MSERAPTGGEKVFEYSKADLKRIRSEDTESTSKFKQSLGEWREKKAAQKIERERRMQVLVRVAILGGALVLAIAILFILLR